MSSATPNQTGAAGAPPTRHGLRRAFSRQPQQSRQAPKRFSGQQQDEKVILFKRKHWWFLVKPGWRAAVLLLGLVGVIILHVVTPRVYSPIWVLLEAIIGVTFLIFLLRWAYTDVADWWFHVYIVTNKRLIIAHGLLQPQRKEAPLDKIQQVYMDVRGLWQYLLNYGDIILPTSAGPLEVRGVSNPRTVIDQILDDLSQYNAARKGPPEEPVKDETMRKVIEDLGKPTVIAPPPSPDPPPKPGAAPAPARKFGGPLHLNSKVRYQPDERTVQYIRRHPYILFRKAAPGGALIVLMMILALVFHLFLWPLFLAGSLLGLGWIGYCYIDYVDDIYILTTHRVIDIDRGAFIFFEGRAIVEYSKVQDVIVEVPSVIARSFDFGTVRIETAGLQQKIRMKDVPNPFGIQDAIFQRINAVKERDTVNAANKQKAELKRWFAAVANAMYELRTPDLVGKSFEEAADLLSRQNLLLRVAGEQQSPGMPPGHVIHQTPPPGTLLGHEGQVQIVLSKL
jgi:membrane protein YdbS with pleckstrin-like domain